MSATISNTVTGERADLLESLGKARFFLRFTARDLTDEQAAQRSTVSALSIGGLVKHVTAVERQWARFIVEGTEAMAVNDDPAAWATYADGFRLLPGETLAGVLADYERVAAETDELVRTLADLDVSHPLPAAPWFEPGARWSARRTFQHIFAETAQHAGHADIIREAIDGSKSMG
ncbi:DinB family protein [Dactylosporangium sp. NPDC051485]|uniref:DinB family protein n=1 Tax=Dactylosporangium sp. NPDC051485 TaxID=3154846 RepID=UPI0034165552